MATGRFAPSPSGDLHLGNLRTALVAWLRARSTGGEFLIRMEDLGENARTEFRDRQLAQLEALGLTWDGPVVRQSDRREHYAAAIATLVEAGLTYPCYCSRREIREAVEAPHGELPDGAYPGTCRDLDARGRARRERSGRPAALRLRTQGESVTFDDLVHGRSSGQVDDVVLCRNDGTPAYNLIVVVDDVAQGVDEVVRGDDLLSSTPRQVHLARLLGLEPRTHAHVPLVLAPNGNRLSKRDGAVSLDERVALGESAAEVRTRLAASLGLGYGFGFGGSAGGGRVAGDGVVPIEHLLEDFRIEDLPREPWVLDPDDL